MSDKQQIIVDSFNNAKDNEVMAVVGAEAEQDDEPLGYLSTRIPMLDYLIGRPGIPIGGITTLVGPYGSSKSTVISCLIAEVQSRGGMAFLLETEGRFSPSRARQLGVNTDDLVFIAPDTLQSSFQSLQRIIEVARKELPPEQLILLAMDSVAGAPLKEELEGVDYGVGLHARIISQWMRVLSPLVRRQNIALVFTAQPRSTISFGGFGKADTTFIGERPLGHASKILIGFTISSHLGEDKSSPNGFNIIAEIKDSRISPRRFWKRTFHLYGDGIHWGGSALEVLVEIGMIKQKGGWYQYLENKAFRASEFEEKLEDWPELREAISLAPLLWQEGIHGNGKGEE